MLACQNNDVIIFDEHLLKERRLLFEPENKGSLDGLNLPTHSDSISLDGFSCLKKITPNFAIADLILPA